MGLEGTIKDFSPVEIFQTIGHNKRTGVLMLKKGEGEEREFVSVFFENGLIVNVESFPKKIEHKLGEVLLSQGVINQQKLNKILSIQNKTKKKMGEIIIELGFAPREKVKEALNFQARMILIDVIQWKDGDFKFKPSNIIDWDKDWFNPIPVDSLLMEAMQVLDEWPVIKETINDDNMVFTVVETGKELKIIAPDEDEKTSDKAIYLTREEFEILKLIDGERTVRDIESKITLPKFFVYKSLHNLIRKGVIEEIKNAKAFDEEIARLIEEDKKRISIKNIIRITILIAELILFVFAIEKSIFYPFNYSIKDNAFKRVEKTYSDFISKVEKKFE